MQTWSAHRALYEWRKDKVNGLHISSIMLKNENVPLFEERWGFLDYDWLLMVTRGRVCKTTDPVVIKYVSGNNLSLNDEYRSADFWMNLKQVDGNKGAMKRICSTRGKYYYYIGETKKSRFWFMIGKWNIKNLMYYVTSFISPLRKYVCSKYRVMN